MLFPEYVLEGWSTTLGPEIADEQIIALYRDHATHEQFHAEFKTDMDLNRLPRASLPPTTWCARWRRWR